MVEPVIIVALLGLNVFQLIYWSRQVHKLIDKLMSRNYADYQAWANKPEVALPAPQVPLQFSVENDDEDLQRLNGIMAGIN
jgi:hypothetical protein